jgi:hypothetical protein
MITPCFGTRTLYVGYVLYQARIVCIEVATSPRIGVEPPVTTNCKHLAIIKTHTPAHHTMSPSSDVALAHLQQLQPTDEWKLEYKKGTTRVPLMRLTRRSVPITDTFFLDVVYDQDATHQVVGLLAAPVAGLAQAQVLVDRYGKPVSSGRTKIQLVTVRHPQPVVSNNNNNNNTAASSTVFTDAQNRDLLFYGGSAVMAAIVFRLVTSAIFGLSILALPLVYLYLVYNCPAPESFDAKKELKRALRGHHLPENHRDKPKGILEETWARVQASVATELATLPGYEVTLVSLAGAIVVASCRVPSVRMDYYWIGAGQRWWYVYANPLREATTGQ